MRLSRALFISVFGHDSSTPKRTAYFRVTILCLGSLSAGLFMRSTLPELEATMNLPSLIIFYGFCMVFYGSVITPLFYVTAMNSRSKLPRLLATLPANPFRIWLNLQQPYLLTTVAMLLFLAPPLQQLSILLGLKPAFFLCALLVGVSCAYGALYGTTGLPRIVQAVISYSVLGLEFISTRAIASTWQTGLWHIIVVCCLLFCCLGLLRVPVLVQKTPRSTIDTYSQLAGKGLPVSFWFTKKVLRGCLPSLYLTLFLSVLSMICLIRLQATASTAAFVGALLAAAFISDFRGLCRQVAPPEMSALQGTVYFVKHYFATIWLALAGISPVIAICCLFAHSKISMINNLLTVLFGCALGYLAGAYFVPRRHDTSSQCFAVLFCMVAIMALSRYTAGFSSLRQTALYLGAIMSATLLSIGIELARNPFNWRSK